MATLTKDQISLLLFLETRAVDHGGAVNTAHMNVDDMTQAKEWNEAGYIRFGRITYATIPSANMGRGECSHWVELTDDSWVDAHAERQARAERALAKRSWVKTSEKNAVTG